MLNKLNALYEENIKTHIYSKSLLSPQIAEATQLLINSLLRGNKVLLAEKAVLTLMHNAW